MSTSEALRGEGGIMVKMAKMELLRTFVSECLSAAAEEILKIVERTIVGYEEEMSCSKWVVDGHRRLLDAAMSHSEESLQTSLTDVKQLCGLQLPPASVNVSLHWEEPGNSTSEPAREHLNARPDSSPASGHGESDGDDEAGKARDTDAPPKLHGAKKPFKCPVCSSVFSSKKTMVRHVKRHPEDKSSFYRCQFCKRHFHHKSDFIIHTRIHKGSRPHKCQDCDRTLDLSGLLIQRQKHLEEKTGQCFTKTAEPDPDAETRLGSARRQQKTFPLTIAPFDKSEFEQESLQPLCLYQIQTVADIDKDPAATLPVQHIKTEPADGASDAAGDPPPPPPASAAEQDEAEEETRGAQSAPPRRAPGKPAELVVQFEAGTAQKPYKCPCCSKCFSLTKTLIRHVKIHTEDKPYQCRFCGRNFCQKSDLVNHTRIHTGERPYQCQECHKSFAQKGNLVVHMRKHTGEKPYQCQECGCCFSQKSSLDCHMQNHR